jgi:predicted glycogen debranching enzyme
LELEISLTTERTSPLEAEWLEADGLGGFASGTASGLRTRRYHALLLHASTPPTGRVVLVAALEAWLDSEAGSFALSSHAYLPDAIHPDGVKHLFAFAHEPWPRWTYRLPDGSEVVHEVFVPRGAAAVVASWRLANARPGRALLRVRPLLAGRDYHALHHENPAFRFEPAANGCVRFEPYPGSATAIRANGVYLHEPLWLKGFRYDEERARGFEHAEDLASPGCFRFDLAAGEAVWLAAAGAHEAAIAPTGETPLATAERLRAAERSRRAAFASPLERAADAYFVRRGRCHTIVAGYPWFTDWGRDTFIALRGLCLAGGRLDVAREIALAWADAVSDGMLPNRFADAGEAPEYNAVDASLWYVVAVCETLATCERAGQPVAPASRARLEAAVAAILGGYQKGTRYGIRVEADGLVAAGEPGVQLTWMDARIGTQVVTPRIGKPVEVQALWVNALRLAGEAFARAEWGALAERACRSFARRFWNEAAGCLYDVVDDGHQPGALDPTLRPNQIFTVGGLPFALLGAERARRVVDLVEAKLWTPLGLRSLAPEEPAYRPRYAGGPAERDCAYHQGTVWPWLLGPFVEAWLRVRGGRPAAKREARARFLAPLFAHLGEAGLGHVSEVADAEAPHVPGGCPFQAWSLGELLRLEREVLGP